MKKCTSFSIRVLSMMLVILLCMGTLAIGIIPGSALEVEKNEIIYADELFPDSIVNEGAILRTSGTYRGVTRFAVYYDGDLIASTDDRIVIQRRGKLMSRNESKSDDIFLELYFQDIDPREKVEPKEDNSASSEQTDAKEPETEAPKAEVIYADDVFAGDVMDKGTILRTSGTYRGVTRFAVYFDGEFFASSEDRMTLDRPCKVLSREEEGGSDIFLSLYFEDLSPKDKADSNQNDKTDTNDNPTSSSTEYEIAEGKVVYADNLSQGDILNEGAIVRTDGDDRGVTQIAVYFDDELVESSGDRIVMDRRGMLMSRKESYRGGGIFLELYLHELGADANADSEETLRISMKRTNTINLSADIELKDTVTIDDGKTHYFNANGYNISLNDSPIGAIVVKNGSTLTINGSGKGNDNSAITNSGGNAVQGGAILVSEKSKLVMKNMTISENEGEYGGGVYVENSTAEISRCVFQKNKAANNGGALYVDQQSVAKLTDCEINKNDARGAAGIVNYGTLTVDNCKVKGNNIRYKGSGGGAGIWSNGDATITKTEILQNANALYGGGVTNRKNMTLKDCKISANMANEMGGGVYIDAKDGNTVMENCTITNNIGKVGGGITLYKGDLTVKTATLENNNASEAGGALWANAGTTADFTDAQMSNNTCKTNGGCLNSHGKLSLNRCTIDGCSADNSGGGIYMDSNDTLTLQSSEITNCMSGTGGAGINFYAGSLILKGGKTRITDSTTGGNSSNVYFRDFKVIQIEGRLSSGSNIGLTPPSDGDGINITSGFSQHNEGVPADSFFCDNNQFKINRDEGVKEANLIKTMKASDRSSYQVRIEITVTDDVDTWEEAHFRIKGRADRGLGDVKELNYSHNFEGDIDSEGDFYSYEYDCGSEYFPSTIEFESKWGDLFPREFEADIDVSINGISVASRHIRQEGNGKQTRTSYIDIGGDKYPFPDEKAFEVDMPKEIDTSGIITVSAVDQYGLKWTAKDDKVTMENVSFPGEDTIESVDSSGFKWKVSSTHKSLHHSKYKMTFKSGSNVYPTITMTINVKFIFPLHLTVIVDGEEVFEASAYSRKTVHFENLKVPTGYYISQFDKEDLGILDDLSGKNEETGEEFNSYNFTFVNDSVVLTAVLEPIYYDLLFEKNGSVEVNPRTGRVKKDKDVKGYISNTTLLYDQPEQLPKSTLTRKNYTFVGWNTQPDGMGKMYDQDATVVNLTTKKGDTVTLYAIWKPVGSASTTASIFSDGTALIYVGLGILILSIAAAVIYYRKKKREGKEQTADEA